MSRVYIEVHLAETTVYTKIVTIDLKKPVSALKKLLCDIDLKLNRNPLILACRGEVMDDSKPLGTYDLSEYAMIHVSIDTKHVPKPPKVFSSDEIMKLKIVLQSLKNNSPFRTELLNLRYPGVIGSLIVLTPGLKEDIEARTLLLHPELLYQVGNIGNVKELVDEHPALGSALFRLLNVGVLDSTRRRASQFGSSDEDDPSTLSEAISASIARSEITTPAQLALAISNATEVQRLQLSTSGSSTSDDNSSLDEFDIARHLEMMYRMGFTNDAINRQALEQSNDLGTAIELVLGGFTGIDNNEQNNQ